MLRERLLDIDGEMVVKPSEYALTLRPFQNILVHHGKELGCKMFAYVYFMRDPRSLYSANSEDVRHREVSKSLFGDEDFEVDEFVQAALDMYNEQETSILKLLRSSRESMDKLQRWLSEIDITDDDYDALKHVKILESIGKTVDSIKKLEEAAAKEADENKTYGDVELSEWNR
jgi:hypothetical protein